MIKQNTETLNRMFFVSTTGRADITAGFERVKEDLKYGDFASVADTLEKMITSEVHNPGLYLARLMATCRFTSLSDFYSALPKVFEKTDFKRAYDYSSAEQRAVLDDIKVIAKATSELADAINERDAEYQKAVWYLSSEISYEVEKAIPIFTKMGSYKDSPEKIKACEEKIARLRPKEDELMKLYAAECAKKKAIMVIGTTFTIIVGLAIFVLFFILTHSEISVGGFIVTLLIAAIPIAIVASLLMLMVIKITNKPSLNRYVEAASVIIKSRYSIS